MKLWFRPRRAEFLPVSPHLYLTPSRAALVSAPISMILFCFRPTSFSLYNTACLLCYFIHEFTIFKSLNAQWPLMFLKYNSLPSPHINYYLVLCSKKSCLPGFLEILEMAVTSFFGFPVFFLQKEQLFDLCFLPCWLFLLLEQVTVVNCTCILTQTVTSNLRLKWK